MSQAVSLVIHEPLTLDLLTEEIIKSRKKLVASHKRIAFVFMTEHFFAQAEEILESIRVDGHAGTVIGCSGSGVLGTNREIEQTASLSILLMNLPEKEEFQGFHYDQNFIESLSSHEEWFGKTGTHEKNPHHFIVLTDPFTVDSLAWMKSWNKALKDAPTVGGLASGDIGHREARVFLDGQSLNEGGVGLQISGSVELHTVVSQGCIPIGRPHVITKAEQNIIFELGGRPAYEVLNETVNSLSEELQQRARGNLFIGFVMNEYQENFSRGDFLVRNLLGADQSLGALAVGEWPETGHTIQFQLRDADAAHEDLTHLLEKKKDELGDREIISGLMFVCNGRGKTLFQTNDHDAKTVSKVLGDFPLAGFFCNGEIGPVGANNYLHGYTAVATFFVLPHVTTTP